MTQSLTSHFSEEGQAREFYMNSLAPTPEGYVVIAQDESTMIKIVAPRPVSPAPEVI